MARLAVSFWSNVQKTERCWLWLACSSEGYGRRWYNGRWDRAHRVAWMLTKGDIPKGLDVLHRCDNSLCVNPAHLYLGTAKDNMHDCSVRYPKKLRKGKACLHASEILSIRDLSQSKSSRQLADIFEVSQSTIINVLSGSIWCKENMYV